MQEQITDKTIVLTMQGGKLTSKLLAKALKKVLEDIKKKQTKTYKGKQSVKKLVKQNVGVTNIEISEKNIKSFESVARKYGVDFAVKKDKSVDPPKWLVFFKARDADALTGAFSEYTAKTLKKSAFRSSVLKRLQKMKEVVKNQVVDKTRQKTHGGHEL